jgi:hypothetical protein
MLVILEPNGAVDQAKLERKARVNLAAAIPPDENLFWLRHFDDRHRNIRVRIKVTGPGQAEELSEVRLGIGSGYSVVIPGQSSSERVLADLIAARSSWLDSLGRDHPIVRSTRLGKFTVGRFSLSIVDVAHGNALLRLEEHERQFDLTGAKGTLQDLPIKPARELQVKLGSWNKVYQLDVTEQRRFDVSIEVTKR